MVMKIKPQRAHRITESCYFYLSPPLCHSVVFRNFIGSLISRVAVDKNFVKSIFYMITPHLFRGIFIWIKFSYDCFYHEFHEWTNDTNLLCFSIRAIRDP